MANNIPPFG